MFVCAGRNETFPFARPIGTGLIESAVNLTRICLFDRPDCLLFVGSAGSYGNHQILDIVESETAANIELSYLTNQSYTPLDNVITMQESVSHETEKSLIVNSSNYITTDSRMAEHLLKLGMELENMEFFSVLSVAKEFTIPARGIFVVTNFCNPQAHEDFVQNHALAKEKLIDYVKNQSESQIT